MKKIIISGGRDFENEEMFNSIIADYIPTRDSNVQILHGGAKGADNLAKKYAEFHSISAIEYKAYWNKHGKGAGPIRNEEMAKVADICIAFWNGNSKGTLNMRLK